MWNLTYFFIGINKFFGQIDALFFHILALKTTHGPEAVDVVSDPTQ